VRRCAFAALLLVIALGAGPFSAGTVQAASATTQPHVMVIVEENREDSAVLGTGAAPYLDSLAATYGIASQSFATSHPSLPNYLDLVSGSTQGVHDDGTGYSFNTPELAGQLDAAGIGWHAYMEGISTPCPAQTSGGGYAKKHDPFVYFQDVSGSPACNNVVPYGQLATDLSAGKAPPFLWVTPDLCDDGHDCSTGHMDAWLASQLPTVLASAWFDDHGVVIITFDEGSSDAGCCGGASGGHVATLVIAHDAPVHRVLSTPVDHAGTLRTIETLYGLPLLGDAACSCSGDLLGLFSAEVSPLSWVTIPRLR